MTPHTIPQTVLFPDLLDKPLVALRSAAHQLRRRLVLFKAAEKVYGLVDGFVRCLVSRGAWVPARRGCGGSPAISGIGATQQAQVLLTDLYVVGREKLMAMGFRDFVLDWERREGGPQ